MIIPFLVFGMCLLLTDITFAQWSTTIAVTADDMTDKNPAMTVALGGRVYVAFESNRTGTTTPGDNNIWVTYWDGIEWSSDEQVSLTSQEEIFPDMTTDSMDRPWVVWFVAGGPYARYHNGTNWSTPMRVHNGTLAGYYPDAAADNSGYVYVTWQHYNGAGYDIYCSQFDPGTSLWATRQITNTLFINEERPQIAIDNTTGNIYFFFMSNADNNLMPNTQSAYAAYLDGGAGSPANFASATLMGNYRADTTDSGNIYFDRPTSLVWDDFRTSLLGGWFSSGTDLTGVGQRPVVNDMPGGLPPWTTPPMVLSIGSPGQNSGPSLIREEDTNLIWATWTSTRDGNNNIYSNYYDGFSWIPTDIRVCQNPASDTVDFYTQASPGICYDIYGGNGRVWTAWTSDRDGNSNIYVAENEAPFDNEPPIFVSEAPSPGDQNVPLDAGIYIEIVDDAWGPNGNYSPCGVNIDSLVMVVEGETVIDMNNTPPNQYDPDDVTITSLNKFFRYGITYVPPTNFEEGAEVDVYLYVCDRGDNDTGNALDRNCTAYAYSFYASEYSWPQFQHDTQHTGLGYFTAPNLNEGVKWYDAPGGYAGSPVVGVGDRVVFGTSDGFLNVMGANGAIIQRFNAGSDVSGAPALASDGTIYFGTASGIVMAVDSSNYSLKWQRQTGGAISAPITITPDGIVIVASEDGKVYALQSNNNLLWQYQTNDKIKAAPTSDDEGNVYVATYSGTVYCLYNGTINWIFQTQSKSPIESSPTLSPDGTVVFGSFDGNIYGLYKLSGNLRDSYNIGTAIIGSPAVDIDGNIYFGSGFTVYCLGWDAFTNNMVLLWDYTNMFPEYKGYFNSSPCLSYRDIPIGFDSVFIGNNTGIMFQLDMNLGTTLAIWDQMNGGAISTAPAIGRNQVLYVAAGPRMYAFGPGTGNNAPRLYDGSCTPSTGNLDTVFEYNVTYFDVDQDKPQVAFVYIDGSQFTMTLKSGYAHSGTYTYSTKLLSGYSHSYYFYFADGKGGTVYLYDPGTGNPFDGPDVGNPQLFSGNYTGSCPAITYSVTYQDQFAASDAKLYVDSIAGDMTIGSFPPNMLYTSGAPVGANAHDYYCFEFIDNLGNRAFFPQGGGWIDGPNCNDATDASWGTFKGNRLRTGVSDFASTSGPDILWTYDLESPMFSSPILDNSDNVYIGTYAGKFFSIDPSGALRWSFETGSDIRSTATMDTGGNIYFGTKNGRVYSLTAGGVQRWTFQTGGAVYGSPAVTAQTANGRVYIASSDTRLYCLSQASGAEIWNYQNPNNSQISFSSPCIGPTGLIYYGSIDGTMWAVKDNDTAPILQWTYSTSAAIESTPTVTRQGDLIFGSSDYNIYSLHIFNLLKDTDSNLFVPELNWSYKTGNSVPSSASVNSANMIAIGSRDKHLYYLYPSGVKKWDYQTQDFVESSPTIDADDNVIFSSRDGRVYSQTDGGQTNWIFEDLGDEDTGRAELMHVYTSPAITSEGNVIFGGWNNYILYCLKVDESGPYFANETPATGASDVSIDLETLSVDILDDYSDIDIDSIVMTVQNETVTPTLTKLTPPPYGYTVSLNVVDEFEWGEYVEVVVYGCDSSSQVNCSTIGWAFTMESDTAPPQFFHLNPGDGGNVAQNFIITMTIQDFESGIDPDSIKMSIAPAGATLWRNVTQFLSIFPVTDGYYVQYDYPGLYPSGRMRIQVEASDRAQPTPNTEVYTYMVRVQLGSSPEFP